MFNQQSYFKQIIKNPDEPKQLMLHGLSLYYFINDYFHSEDFMFENLESNSIFLIL